MSRRNRTRRPAPPQARAEATARIEPGPAGAPLSARALVRVFAVLVLVWTVSFAPQLFAHRVFVLGDAAAFRPFSDFSRARWNEVHERTFWNPYVFAGLPSTASLADGRPQYLPDAALDAIERLHRLPLVPPLAMPLLAHLAGMLAAALLARALWRAGPAGMATAGIAWGLMPNLTVPFAFGHDAQFTSSALIPTALLAVHELFAQRERIRVAWATLALGVMLGLQGLIGHPQILAYCAALVVAFAIERARRFGRTPRLGPAAAALVFGAALSAAVWLPALRYSAYSVRGGPWGGVSLEEVARFSHAVRDLASLVWPWAVGFAGNTYWGGLRQTDYPQYLGLTVCALALAAWPRRGERDAGTATFFLAVAAAAVVLSLGAHLGALYRLIYASVPLISKFRVAVAVLVIAQLAMALLAARGIERLLVLPSRGTAAARLTVGAAVVMVIGLTVAYGPLRGAYGHAAAVHRPALSGTPGMDVARHAGRDLMWRGLLVAAIAAALAAATRRRGATARPALALLPVLVLPALVAFDLASVEAPILARATGPPSALAAPPPPPLARVAAAHPLMRALPLRRETFLSNDWVSWRARSIAGNHGAVSAYWSDLLSAGLMRHSAALCALSVGYLAGDGGLRVDSTLCEPVVEGDSLLPVLALRGAMPRAYAVPRVESPGDDDAVLAGLFGGAFEPTALAFVDRPEAAGDYPGSAGLRIRWIEDEPDRLVIETRSAGRAFLVVADAWFPGWRATVDDHATPIDRVDVLVRGLAVPAGTHRVIMRYRPEGWTAGVASTRASLTVLLLAVGALAVIGRRRREPPRA